MRNNIENGDISFVTDSTYNGEWKLSGIIGKQVGVETVEIG